MTYYVNFDQNIADEAGVIINKEKYPMLRVLDREKFMQEKGYAPTIGSIFCVTMGGSTETTINGTLAYVQGCNEYELIYLTKKHGNIEKAIEVISIIQGVPIKYKYKLCYVNIIYQNRKTITLMRVPTEGGVVEIIKATESIKNSYDPIYKSLRYFTSENLDIFEKVDPYCDCMYSEELLPNKIWQDTFCPQIYRDRPDLYLKVDIEHPLYAKIKSKIGSKAPNFMSLNLTSKEQQYEADKLFLDAINIGK